MYLFVINAFKKMDTTNMSNYELDELCPKCGAAVQCMNIMLGLEESKGLNSRKN